MRKKEQILELQNRLLNEIARRSEAEARVKILRDEIESLHLDIDVIVGRVKTEEIEKNRASQPTSDTLKDKLIDVAEGDIIFERSLL